MNLVCLVVVKCDLGCRDHEEASRGGPAQPSTLRWLHPSHNTINRVSVLFPRLARRSGSANTGEADLCKTAAYGAGSECFFSILMNLHGDHSCIFRRSFRTQMNLAKRIPKRPMSLVISFTHVNGYKYHENRECCTQPCPD